MAETVECHAGFRYAERPRAFLWEGQRLEVAQVQARARTPQGFWFRVRTADGRLFELVYREAQDSWLIEPAGAAD